MFGFGQKTAEETEEEPVYYIDLVRYLLYMASILLLFSAFNLYADDFLGENKDGSGAGFRAILPLILTLMAGFSLCMFHHDGVTEKLYWFIGLLGLSLVSRRSSAGWYTFPYFLCLVLSMMIVLMVWLGCTDVVAFNEADPAAGPELVRQESDSGEETTATELVRHESDSAEETVAAKPTPPTAGRKRKKRKKSRIRSRGLGARSGGRKKPKRLPRKPPPSPPQDNNDEG